MKNNLFAHLALLLLGSVVLLLGSCGATQRANFYTLQALSGGGPDRTKVTEVDRISLGVGPVDFPEYLDRPQIVTRVGQNELRLAEFDRWAGPLQDDFTRVLAENLAVLLGTNQVATFPWQQSTQDYQVTLTVLQFDGSLGGQAVLTARWSIFGKGGKQTLMVKKSTVSAPVQGPGYQELVSAENQVVNELSREIASAITAMGKPAD